MWACVVLGFLGSLKPLREVKRRILELYGLPMELQRLQCTPDIEDECLDDSIHIFEVLGSQARAMKHHQKRF